MKLYLIRHAKTKEAEDGIHQNDNVGVIRDLIDPNLVFELKPDKVYSSPLQRAKETAEILFGEYEDPEPAVTELKMKDGSIQKSLESVDGVAIFYPTSAAQSIRIARFLLEEAPKIKGAFMDPDARATIDLAQLIEPIGFKRAVANVYEFEKGNIIALRQRSPFRKKLWEDFPILLHHKLHTYLVSGGVKP